MVRPLSRCKDVAERALPSAVRWPSPAGCGSADGVLRMIWPITYSRETSWNWLELDGPASRATSRSPMSSDAQGEHAVGRPSESRVEP